MPEQRSRGFFVYSAWIASILKFRSIRGVLILPQRPEFAIDRQFETPPRTSGPDCQRRRKYVETSRRRPR